MVQIRYPSDLVDLYPTPLASDGVFDESDQARTDHHNDCFLANEHDAGTYFPLERQEEFQKYLDQVTPYVAVGGETTCQVTQDQHRPDCPTALAELERFRWSYLNEQFFAPAIQHWKEG